jgi:hypothetical protein
MMNIKLGKAWTTHIGVLVKVLYASTGDVVEMGAGPASTPLLHWICKDMNRKLISYEANPDYYNYARQFASWLHKIVLVKNWDDIDTKTHRGVVFIDHATAERRSVDALRFKDSADYIVMHDSDAEKFYGYDKIWKYFKYRYDWKACRPWVSVVSNFKNLILLNRHE